MATIGTDLSKAKDLLDNDELVAIPTETVYGLAGNGFSDNAVLKIFSAKNRPSFDPLIAHTDKLEKVGHFVQDIPEMAKLLVEEFWPGSLTVLLPKKKNIPDVMTSGLPQVAVRIPDHPLTLQLLSMLDYPLAAPSANPFGYTSPTTAKHVQEKLGGEIQYILEGGRCNLGLESTIIGFEQEEPVVYRLGGVPVEEIEKICGKVRVQTNQSSNPKAPGMIKSHYAPGKPLAIVDIDQEIGLVSFDPKRVGVISFVKDHRVPHQYILSKNGSLEHAAFNLFTALRHFDDLPVERLIVELVPEEGIGRAINDRLRRAAFR